MDPWVAGYNRMAQLLNDFGLRWLIGGFVVMMAQFAGVDVVMTVDRELGSACSGERLITNGLLCHCASATGIMEDSLYL